MEENLLNDLLGPEPTEPETIEQEPTPAGTPPAGEAPAAEPAATEPAAPQHRTVPYEALAEERVKRQQLQERMAQLEQGYTRMLEWMQQPAAQPAGEPPASGVTFEDDPIGYLREQNEQLQARLDSMREQQEAPVRMQQQVVQLQTAIEREEAAFAAEVPDYRNAVEFIHGRRMQELTALGLSQPEIMQAMAGDVMQLAAYARQRGQSLPALVYNYAKQVGYTGAPAQHPAAPAAKPTAPSSLGGTSAPADTGGMPGLDAIGNMSDEEFDAFWRKYEKAARVA